MADLSPQPASGNNFPIRLSQTTPDLVVKLQPVDIVGFIL
jgi:hypothetical protein